MSLCFLFSKADLNVQLPFIKLGICLFVSVAPSKTKSLFKLPLSNFSLFIQYHLGQFGQNWHTQTHTHKNRRLAWTRSCMNVNDVNTKLKLEWHTKNTVQLVKRICSFKMQNYHKCNLCKRHNFFRKLGSKSNILVTWVFILTSGNPNLYPELHMFELLTLIETSQFTNLDHKLKCQFHNRYKNKTENSFRIETFILTNRWHFLWAIPARFYVSFHLHNIHCILQRDLNWGTSG